MVEPRLGATLVKSETESWLSVSIIFKPETLPKKIQARDSERF